MSKKNEKNWSDMTPSEKKTNAIGAIIAGVIVIAIVIFFANACSKAASENQTDSSSTQTTTETASETTSDSSTVTEEKGEAIDLSTGKYLCGTDFKPGKYDITLVSGTSGNVICTTEDLNEIFSTDPSFGITSYSNAQFYTGDTLEIDSNITIHLEPK